MRRWLDGRQATTELWRRRRRPTVVSPGLGRRSGEGQESGWRTGGSHTLLAAAQTSEAALVVQSGLLPLGAEEPPVPQFAQDAGALHRGLEPLQEALAIFSFT